MATAEPVRIRRIGLVLELEDGSKVMLYSDDLPNAQATITTETPTEAALDPWGLYRVRPVAPPVTSILLEGIGSHAWVQTPAEAKVSAPGRQLEAIRREVNR